MNMYDFLNKIIMGLQEIREDIEYDYGSPDSVPQKKLEDLIGEIEDHMDEV